MRILIYEHISEGGYSDLPISLTALAEGFGMLRTVISDFKMAGHEITVLLDWRISKLNPYINADLVVPIFYAHEAINFLAKIATVNDAILIIAPETGQTLQYLVELIEKTGKVSLNCKSSAISKVANKAILYQILQKNQVPIPKTLVLSVKADLVDICRAIKTDLSYPAVFKPVDGASCGGLSVVKEEKEIKRAIEKIKAESTEEDFIIQEFIIGEAVSVSLICAIGKALPISLNQQTINASAPEGPSYYEGGMVPFDHPLKQIAFAIAEKTVGCFEGLRGYVGVDLVLAKNKVFAVDVNPRLTTSYVGLSRVANFNVAEALINSILRGELPIRFDTTGYASFSKLTIPNPTTNIFNNIVQLSNVISPPFPLNDNQTACGLIIGQGDSMEQAKFQLEEAKKRVLNIISRGK